MIIWSDEYLTGIKDIDSQHKQFFDICRKFELLMQVPDGVYIADDAVKILCELRDYVTFHFYTEESYMKKIDYKNFEEHKKEHDELKKRIMDVDVDNIFNGNNIELKILLNLLYGWILNHVQIKDMELRRC